MNSKETKSTKALSRSAIKPLNSAFYSRDPRLVARDLIGRYIVRHVPDGSPNRLIVVRIVETEAYLGTPDPASHAYAGRRTRRNASLYLEGGHAYVYFIYGMHYCLNVVTGSTENGDAVLIRAAEVVVGEHIVQKNRGLDHGRKFRPVQIAGGPARLCQALGVGRDQDGHRLSTPPLQITAGQPVEDRHVLVGPRVGIGYAGAAVHWPLRFALNDSPSISNPRATLQALSADIWKRILAGVPMLTG